MMVATNASIKYLESYLPRYIKLIGAKDFCVNKMSKSLQAKANWLII
jgi:hypothetical protein